MRPVLLSIFLLAAANTFAQTGTILQVARKTSEQNLKKNLYALASDRMAGRLMGSHGDTLASQYVAAAFLKSGVEASYENGKSYYQTIEATRYDDKAQLGFNGQTYADLDGWDLYPNDPYSAENIPVLIDNLSSVEDWNKHISELPLAGSAVLLNNALFNDFGRLDSLEKVLVSKGVRLVIWSGPHILDGLKYRKEHSFLPVYKEPDVFNEKGPLFEMGLSPALFQKLLVKDNLQLDTTFKISLPPGKLYTILLTAISVTRGRTEVKVYAPNVIGIIKGTDPYAGAVILSAHHDHEGRNGEIIYYGAVDNASGTVSLMEIAELLHQAKLKGLRPKRTIILGSWTGEERGLLGSFYYSEHPLIPLSQTFAVLNMDMLGRIDTLHQKAVKPDSNYAYILVKDDTLKHALRRALFDANQNVGLTLDAYYEQPKYERRRLIGSDQYPFYLKGIPFVRIDCGFAKEYHQPEDTPDKIDYPLLTKQVQLAFLTVWNMANL